MKIFALATLQYCHFPVPAFSSTGIFQYLQFPVPAFSSTGIFQYRHLQYRHFPGHLPLTAERQAGKLRIPIFIVFGLTRLGIEPESTVSVADALPTRPLIGTYL